jgi:subtilase family serine protease
LRTPTSLLPSGLSRARRRLAVVGASVASVLLLAACGGGTTHKAVATHSAGSGSGVVTVTAASHIATLSDCVKLRPALCFGVRQYLTAYGIEPLHGRGIDGRGQSVVLVEFAPGKTASASISATDSDLRDDLAVFDGLFGLPAARIQVITRSAGAGNPYLAGGEEAMDAEMVHAVAPAATIRIVLLPEGNGHLQATGATFINALRLAPSLGSVVAVTAGISERCVTKTEAANLNATLQADEKRHVTVIASSGDDGAAGVSCTADPTPELVRAVNLPASDPLVLSVGGTTLDASPATGAYIGETAWSSPAGVLPANAPEVPASVQAELLPMGSNGGFSSLFARPSYQDGIAAIGQMRGVPDVSADAGSHTGMAVALHLTPGDVVTTADGTSAGSPFWAGIVALADQDAGHALGFINPAIYQIGRSSSYQRAFHDITTGDNTMKYKTATVTGYQAAAGWDPVTGWGTPNAQVLVPLLADDQ